MSPRGELSLRTLAMPRDANPNGDIFGGWVLSQMDIAAGMSASQRARGRVATVTIDAMTFKTTSCVSIPTSSASAHPQWRSMWRRGCCAIGWARG